MKKLLSALFFIFIISHIVNAQKEGLPFINGSDLKAYMTFFASDEMKGRETGTNGNDVASLYLKTNLMRLGLAPIPASGNYYQKLPLVSSEIKKGESFLKIRNSIGEEIFTTDSLVYLMAPLKTIDNTGSIVFAGYGIEDSTGYSDFKDIDLKDKIVLVMTGNPEKASEGGMSQLFDIDVERPKLMSVFSKGAQAVIFVYNPENEFHDAYTSGLADIAAGKVGSKIITIKDTRDSSMAIQVTFITQYAADMLLKTTGSNLKQMQLRIKTEKKPVSCDLKNITGSLRTYVENIDIESNNVIGMIEGSDPVLKNECVIYTAHFDHEGVNDNGDVYNGADDNASGSMALLEIAQAFINLKKKPKRTIIFAWVNGEEKGLLGSQYYVYNPVFPLEKTVLDINLDMVGRSKMPSDTGKFMGYDVSVSQAGEILLYTDQQKSEIMNILQSASNEAGIKVINMGKEPEIGSSDYACFMGKGVPSVFFNSGDYPDLHTIRDDVDKIDFDKMERVSKMMYLLGYQVANQRSAL